MHIYIYIYKYIYLCIFIFGFFLISRITYRIIFLILYKIIKIKNYIYKWYSGYKVYNSELTKHKNPNTVHK